MSQHGRSGVTSEDLLDHFEEVLSGWLGVVRFAESWLGSCSEDSDLFLRWIDVHLLGPVGMLLRVDPRDLIGELRLKLLKVFFGLLKLLQGRLLDWTRSEVNEANDFISSGANILMGFRVHFGHLLEQPRLFVFVLSDLLWDELLRENIDKVEQGLELEFSSENSWLLILSSVDDQRREFLNVELRNSFLVVLIEKSEKKFALKGS